jgi:hypothetical protein
VFTVNFDINFQFFNQRMHFLFSTPQPRNRTITKAGLEVNIYTKPTVRNFNNFNNNNFNNFYDIVLYFALYSPCIVVQLINSHQQMHQNKFVTDFFIKSLPQYTFRHFYIAIIRGVVEVCTQTDVLTLHQNSCVNIGYYHFEKIV